MKFKLKSLVLVLLLFFLLFFAAIALQQNHLIESIPLRDATLLTLLGLMILAGIMDGFNPCSFTTLLLWSGFLLNRFGRELDKPNSQRANRRTMMGYAWLYALGIMVIYFIFGAGLLQLSNFIQPGDIRLFSKLFGLLVTLMGIVMLRDSLHAPAQWLIKMPGFLHPLFKKYSEPTSKVAAVLSGGVVGLCSIPCSGAIYMAVLLIVQPKPLLERTFVLFFYNLGFIVPVLLFASILANKKLLQALSKDFLISRKVLKRIIAVVTILMGLLSIYLS